MRHFFIITTLIILSSLTAAAQRIVDEHGTIISNGGPVRTTPAPGIGEGSSVAPSDGVGWLPMGAGLWGEVYQLAEVNGELYALQNGFDTPASYHGGISKWDGSQWVNIALFDGTSRGILFTGYQGQLYTQITRGSNYVGWSRWDGQNWTDTRDANTPMFMVGLEYQGGLCAGGWFENIDNVTGGNNIARWDGTAWHAMGTGIDNRDGLAGAGPDNTQVVAMAEYHGKLYVGGRFSHAGGIRSPFLAIWNGTAWEAMPTVPAATVEDLCVLDDTLFMNCRTRTSSAPGVVAAWDGTSLRYLPMPPCNSIFSMAVHGGSLYIAGEMSDGSAVARWNGAEWETFQGFQKDPRSTSNVRGGALIEHNGSLIAGGKFGSFAGTQLSNVTSLCNEGDCGAISGNVFLDVDQDCLRGNNDSALPRRMIMVEPGPIFVASNGEGRYLQHVPPGDYTVSILPPLHWSQTCPVTPATHAATVTGGNDHVADLDFAMKPVPGVRDLRVSVTAGRARPGLTLDYYITYENVGTETIDGSITFTHDPRLTLSSSAPPADRTNPGMLGWDFTGLRPEESRTIHVVLTLPVTLQMGDVLCAYITAEIAAFPELSFNEDNRDSICVTVVNSYDPNDISVQPNGLEDNGEITQADSVLAYTIRFQNTGTDVAYRVIVMDTLSPYLDPASVRPGSSSHPYKLAVSGSGILTWTFNDIYLSDNTSNEPASHGVLKYFVRRRPNLPVGTAIANRVQIYFDYNAPVTTNTVVSTIVGPLGVEQSSDAADMQVTPNPSNGMVWVDGRMRSGGEIVVLDLLGRRVLSVPARDGERQTVDLSGLSNGAYLLALPAPGGTVIRRVMVMR